MISVLKLPWKKENNKDIFRMKLYKGIVIFFFVGFTTFAQTERNVDKQTLIWSRYINQLTINPKWMWQNELDYRNFVSPTVQSQFGFRTQVKHKLNDNIDVGTGFTLFSVSTQDPETIRPYQTPEYRLHQDLTVKQKIGKVNLFHRYQLEERWFQKTSVSQIEKGTNFYWRFRYRAQAEFDLYKKENSYLRVILHDEIMLNGGKKVVKNIFDQNRIYGALQYGINPKTAVEIGFMNVFQQRASGTDYIDRNVIRLTLYHKLKI